MQNGVKATESKRLQTTSAMNLAGVQEKDQGPLATNARTHRRIEAKASRARDMRGDRGREGLVLGEKRLYGQLETTSRRKEIIGHCSNLVFDFC